MCEWRSEAERDVQRKKCYIGREFPRQKEQCLIVLALKHAVYQSYSKVEVMMEGERSLSQYECAFQKDDIFFSAC